MLPCHALTLDVSSSGTTRFIARNATAQGPQLSKLCSSLDSVSNLHLAASGVMYVWEIKFCLHLTVEFLVDLLQCALTASALSLCYIHHNA